MALWQRIGPLCRAGWPSLISSNCERRVSKDTHSMLEVSLFPGTSLLSRCATFHRVAVVVAFMAPFHQKILLTSFPLFSYLLLCGVPAYPILPLRLTFGSCRLPLWELIGSSSHALWHSVPRLALLVALHQLSLLAPCAPWKQHYCTYCCI
jgi:hypothetical protein